MLELTDSPSQDHEVHERWEKRSVCKGPPIMTMAGLLILASGVFLMTLGSLPWLVQAGAARHKLQTFRALRSRNFRWFWLNTSGGGLAQGMQFLILGWLMLELTDSPSQLGLVLFLYGIPNLSLVN